MKAKWIAKVALIPLAIVLAAIILPRGVHGQKTDLTAMVGIGWPFSGVGSPAAEGIDVWPGFSLDWYMFESLAIGYYKVGASSQESCTYGCYGPVDEVTWDTDQLMLHYDISQLSEERSLGVVLGSGRISYSWISDGVPGEWEGKVRTLGVYIDKRVPKKFAIRLQLLLLQPDTNEFVLRSFPLLVIEGGMAW
jgi:hypothetical protein